MADIQTSGGGGGIGLCGATFLVFLILKLVGVINWSWWWITAPLWGSLALVVATLIIVIIIAGIIAVIDNLNK